MIELRLAGIVWALLLLLNVSQGFAQGLATEPEGMGDSVNTGRAVGSVIQPFDRLQITVKREPQLTDVYTVGPGGLVEFPLVGSIQASGRSAADLQVDLETQLSAYLKRPELTVELLEVDRTRTGEGTGAPSIGAYSVYIMGAVPAPGVYYLREPINPFQLLVRAGGINGLTERSYLGRDIGVFPDLANVSVVSEDGSVSRYDLSQWKNGKMQLEMLEPGDTVVVSGHRAGTFAIYGEIAEQGVFEIGQPILLTEAIARAGGLVRFSDFGKIRILRGKPENPEALQVNLKDILAKKQVDLLPVIYPGDTIFIPRNLLSKWFDFVDVMRGARQVTEDVEDMRDHWTLRDIERD